MHVLTIHRWIFALVLWRFTWFYFVSNSSNLPASINPIEAFTYIMWTGFILPHWAWMEKELLCMWLSGKEDLQHTLSEGEELL